MSVNLQIGNDKISKFIWTGWHHRLSASEAAKDWQLKKIPVSFGLENLASGKCCRGQDLDVGSVLSMTTLHS